MGTIPRFNPMQWNIPLPRRLAPGGNRRAARRPAFHRDPESRRAGFLPIAVFVAMVLTAPARAETYFVSPAGGDANDCSQAAPCKTIQAAADKIAIGQAGSIVLADGEYQAGVSITHRRIVGIGGNCADPSRVRIMPGADETAIEAQDGAVVGVTCLTCEAQDGADGARCFRSRQFAIIDYLNMRFGHMPGGGHVSADEISKINCAGVVEIVGDAAYHASASKGSAIDLNCTIAIDRPRAFRWFAIATARAIIDATRIAFTGGGAAATTGQRYVVGGGTLINAAAMPGSRGGEVKNGGVAQ